MDSDHKRPKRGGARNFSSNETDSLSVDHVGKLIAATKHAIVIGLPFNRMITIHWEAAGIGPDSIVNATSRYLDLLTKMLARFRQRTALIWVQESGCGKGGHVHILAHIPAKMVEQVSRLQFKWLRSITGIPYKKRTIKSAPIGGVLNIETSDWALYLEHLHNALFYILKGANEKAAKKFGLTKLEAGGICVGKRCGLSQNVGPKAQSQFQKGIERKIYGDAKKTERFSNSRNCSAERKVQKP